MMININQNCGKDMNSHDFTGCNIRQKSRLVANPVDVHLFTRLAIYRH